MLCGTVIAASNLSCARVSPVIGVQSTTVLPPLRSLYSMLAARLGMRPWTFTVVVGPVRVDR